MSQPMWTPKSSARFGMRAVENRDAALAPLAQIAPLEPDEAARGRESDGEPSRAQARTMEAMGSLAGGIAHVFNNLLTAIGFETELALSRLPADDPARKHLREIEKVGERGAALARQLLAFSGSQVLQARRFQLNEMIGDLLDGLRRQVGESIEVELRLDPDLGLISADREQIGQALLSLASNAREVMPGGGRLVLETANVELEEDDLADPDRIAPGPYVMLRVSDSGPGMSPQVRQRVFEPFFTTKQGAELAGLGLSTVYGIVTQSGGQIRAESEVGQGSTFLIHLPRVAGREGSLTENGRSENWETLLLVEDEDNVRKPLAEILSGQGYTVLEAADAAQALALCRRHAGPIHLMVTDVLLTGPVNGVELAEQLSYERPEMKVLFATGYPAGLADGPHLLRHETLLLKKPFSGRALATRVREVLASSE